jgi:2-polyprenyl-3-methyl-5-hydroxy-6-metoxy-1,4-benzoquinol methylase
MNKNEISEYSRRAKRTSKDYLLFKYCSGKKILDVGCIGQDRSYEGPNWLHQKLRKVASHTDGVDILEDKVQELKQLGFSMFTPDGLVKGNKQYEVIVMADVIEHVNDPVSFLSFYSAFLSEGGVMIISTPNSNRSNNFVNILFENKYSVNPEHTFWFCPKTFSEVINRANLILKEFYWSPHYFGFNQLKGLYQKFKFLCDVALIKFRNNFSPNMIFIVAKK